MLCFVEALEGRKDGGDAAADPEWAAAIAALPRMLACAARHLWGIDAFFIVLNTPSFALDPICDRE